MTNNFLQGAAGFASGFSRQDPFGTGGIASGITMTPLAKLWSAAEQEGNTLASIKKDLLEFGKYPLETGQYLISAHYGDKPKAAAFMNEVIGAYLNPPDFDKMSTKEQETFRKGQVDMIIATIEKVAKGGGTIPEKPWSQMEPAITQKYEQEGALGKRYMPSAAAEWGPEMKGRFFGGIRGEEGGGKPLTGTEMAEARRTGKPLGTYSINYEEFQEKRGTIWRDLGGTELQKSVLAMITKGAGAAVLEPGWWLGESDEERKIVEKRHPFLKDKNAASMLKVQALDNGLIDWSTFSSDSIEASSDEDKLTAWTYLWNFGGFSDDQMWWIFHNWFPGPGTAKEPATWKGLGKSPIGGG